MIFCSWACAPLERPLRARGLWAPLLEVLPLLPQTSAAAPLCLTGTLTSTGAKPEPPTVALLLLRRDAFYIMCASGPFGWLYLFFFFPLTTAGRQEKRPVCQPCFASQALSCSDHSCTLLIPGCRAELNINREDLRKKKTLPSAFLLVTYLLVPSASKEAFHSRYPGISTTPVPVLHNVASICCC